MWDLLSPGISKLFAVLPPTFGVFEKGWYYKSFAKPTKKLATALSTNREILLLLTNFKDQQPRAVEYAKSIIEREGSRLEPIVLIAHSDPEGDAKVKSWGREQLLVVLPIQVSDKLDLSPEAIQRNLCVELFSRDPFDIVSPVVDDVQFYGRRDEALDFARTISSSRIRSCFGIRKIGKTSFINRVLHLVRQSGDAGTISLDCQRDAVWSMSAPQLLVSVSSAIEQLSVAGTRYATPRKSAFAGSMDEAGDILFSSLERSSVPILLAIDELDYITPASATAPHWQTDFNGFWRTLRAVYQEAVRQNRAISLIVSGVSSKWFTQESIAGIENAALHFVPEEYLGPFSDTAATAMIHRLAKSAGLSFSAESQELIASACGHFPFWIRKACSFIHRNIDVAKRPLDVGLADTRALLDRFVSTEGQALAEAAISHLCRIYPDLRSTLVACMNGESAKESTRSLVALSRYGLVDGNDSYKIKGEILLYGLREYLHTSINDANASSATSNKSVSILQTPEDEWLEELAVIGKRRNKLETRMRSQLVTAIKLSKINGTGGSTAKKGTVREVILDCIPEARRSPLQSVGSVDLIMDKLLWTDYKLIVNRHWDAVEFLFKDKKQFELYHDIINDRPDSHAKKYEPEEIALMKRAIQWMEDKLTIE